ncbi:MAG: hypothetical protein Q8L34_03835 [Candidatus Woesearchaeota archaeon]|nr:hypothetical protein [Candidatus Woesearchaeota archaeon]
MKTIQMMEKMRNVPIFTPKLVNKSSQRYANLYLHRLRKQHLVERIEKNLYTIHKDPFLIASRIIWPSYLSCWSGLKFHKLTEQVPHTLFVVVPYYKKTIVFQNMSIVFIVTKSKNIFGYEKINYQGFDIFVADKEKSIIDCALFKKSSFSELKEIIENHQDELNLNKFIRYLKRTGNSSLIKRFGFIFDILGKDFFPTLKRYVAKVYIPLDYTKEKTGQRNKKWMVIENA